MNGVGMKTDFIEQELDRIRETVKTQLEGDGQAITHNFSKLEREIIKIALLLLRVAMKNDQYSAIKQEVEIILKKGEIKKSYNTAGQMAVQIIGCVIGMVGGGLGIAGGIGSAFAMASKAVDSLGSISNGANALSRGFDPINQIVSGKAESEKQGHQIEMQLLQGKHSETRSGQQQNKQSMDRMRDMASSLQQAAHSIFEQLTTRAA